jgi:general secretion pathway protein J
MKRKVTQQGLTLIELLVTMVLLGFVVALMSGAFVQIGQMLRVSAEHGNGFSGRWTQSRTLQEMIANMVPDPAIETPLVGLTTRMTFSTLATPLNANGTAQRISLELRTSSYVAGTSPSTTLHLFEASIPSNQQNNPFELARYDGRLVFMYIDAQGKEHRQWPAQGASTPYKLPKAIGLLDESRQGKLTQIAHYEGEPIGKAPVVSGLFGVSN